MSSSLDHKCQRCGSQYHGQICPFCTITGLDVNALLASEGLSMPSLMQDISPPERPAQATDSEVRLIDVVSNRIYAISGSLCRFGRDISNDTVLAGDKSLSRFHFQITSVNGECFVEDAGSRNGTYLNGAPVTAPRKLLNGDIISAGMSRYRFVIGDDPGPLESENEASAQTEQLHNNGGQESFAVPGQNATVPMQVDPVSRIMQEGQALLGAERPDDAEALDAYFPQDDSDEGEHASGFMRLQPPTDTPVDELFQQQIRAAEEARQQELEASAPPVYPAPPAYVEDLQPSYVEPEQVEQQSSPAAAASPVDETPVPVGEYQTSTNKEWPEWCMKYTFPELAEIKGQMEQLETEIQERQQLLNKLSETVARTEDVRNRVLATRDRELIEACGDVLRILGWQTAANGSSDNELVLSSDDKAAAIAKIVSTDTQPRPADLANLVSSLSTYWSDNGIEPKGILIVSMVQEGAPENRPEFSKDIVDYAAKKNVCLLSTVQLLAMYRDATLRDIDVKSIQTEILSASGHLMGFEPVASKK